MSNTPSTNVDEAIESQRNLLQPPCATCVVVPDATRPLPVEAVLRPLLKFLVVSGSPTSILVGLGLHRPMTDAELEPLRQVCEGLDVEIVQHDARGDDLIDVGLATDLPPSSPPELPRVLNRLVVNSERLICVGTVEPHQYAGFSGGIKAVSIGCAGAETISAMHGLDLLRDPKTTLGRVDDNPFQQQPISTMCWDFRSSPLQGAASQICSSATLPLHMATPAPGHRVYSSRTSTNPYSGCIFPFPT